MPHTLPKSYVSFLDKHGGKTKDITSGIRLVAERNGRIAREIRRERIEEGKSFGRWWPWWLSFMSQSQANSQSHKICKGCDNPKLVKTAHAHALDPKTTSICSFLHPGESCAGHFCSFFPAAYMRAVPVYLPIYLVPMLLVHRDKLFRKSKIKRDYLKPVRLDVKSYETAIGPDDNTMNEFNVRQSIINKQ